MGDEGGGGLGGPEGKGGAKCVAGSGARSELDVHELEGEVVDERVGLGRGPEADTVLCDLEEFQQAAASGEGG